MFKNRNHIKGQAVIEMAIFGSLILIVFGVLVAYMQRMSDEQYVRMETFRRALQEAHTTPLDPSGAKAQVANLQYRRHANVSGGFGEGARQAFQSAASVLWSVPSPGETTRELLILKANDDETRFNNQQFGGVSYSEDGSSFEDTLTKTESPENIVTSRTSTLKDTITTTFMGGDGGKLWEVQQGVYRDSEGKYRYSKDQTENEVQRSRTWTTKF
jgi:hypothetical protein